MQHITKSNISSESACEYILHADFLFVSTIVGSGSVWKCHSEGAKRLKNLTADLMVRVRFFASLRMTVNIVFFQIDPLPGRSKSNVLPQNDSLEHFHYNPYL